MLDPAWSHHAHERVATLGVTAGLCVFAERSRWLTAVDCLTGTRMWSSRVRTTHGTIAFTTSNVIYLNGHVEVIALDRLTGELVWSHRLDDIGGWLQASGETVVVGGWRGYSDVHGLDAGDGRVLWSFPAKGAYLRSINLHFDSDSVVIRRADAAVVFLNLRTGIANGPRLVLPNAGSPLERVDGLTGPGWPHFLRGDRDHLICIEGAGHKCHNIEIPAGIGSRIRAISKGCVGFVTEAGDVAVWLQPNRRVITLGRSQRHRGMAPSVCRIGEASFAAATGNGRLSVFSGDPAVAVSTQTLGKSITTHLTVEDRVLILGTGSGDVLGLQVPEPAA